MTPLEQLFKDEIEFARLVRSTHESHVDAAHTSWALGHGYESLLRTLGKTTTADLDAQMNKLLLTGDPRDVTRARDSLLRILGP